MSFKIPARAKINLCLEVDGVRPDGYHALWSVMHSVTLSDPLRLQNVSDTGLTLSSPTMLPEDNTFVRAYNAFVCAHPEAAFVGVLAEFEKHIPWRAGLGGASADAAAMLMLLHRMFSVPEDDIMELGASVGSDVPFCLMGGCALAEGRGEILTPLREDTPTTHVLLVKGKRGVGTRELFRIYDEQNNEPCMESPEERERRRSMLINAVTREGGIDFSVFRKYARNDLESTVFGLLPEVAAAKAMLYDLGAEFALMTGSGSTVFGVFSDFETMRAAQAEIRRHGYLFIHRTRLAPDSNAQQGERYGKIVLR